MWLENRPMNVIDTDFINQSAKVGIADAHNIVWVSKWVSWDCLQKKWRITW